jgi:hypothetical protein
MIVPQKATLDQVRIGRAGHLIEIDQDVMDVAYRIRDVGRAVGARLGVQYNEESNKFRVYEEGADGKQRTVTWLVALTPNAVEFVQSLFGRDLVADMDRVDAQAEKDRRHALDEAVGPVAEKLHHAIRKDLGLKPRVFVPKDI